jgi:hypothetical protein
VSINICPTCAGPITQDTAAGLGVIYYCGRDCCRDYVSTTMLAKSPPSEDELRRRKMAAILELVNEQAEDESLWFEAQYITEALLQQALRDLHTAIEDE